jgi:uncharacterized protein HemX
MQMAAKDKSKQRALIVGLTSLAVLSLCLGIATYYGFTGREELRKQAADAKLGNDELDKARKKLDAELKAAQEAKEETAKALVNAKADLVKTIADKSAAFKTLQRIVEDRDDRINELKKEVNRLQDRLLEDMKRRQSK